MCLYFGQRTREELVLRVTVSARRWNRCRARVPVTVWWCGWRRTNRLQTLQHARARVIAAEIWQLRVLSAVYQLMSDSLLSKRRVKCQHVETPVNLAYVCHEILEILAN